MTEYAFFEFSDSLFNYEYPMTNFECPISKYGHIAICPSSSMKMSLMSFLINFRTTCFNRIYQFRCPGWSKTVPEHNCLILLTL
jgi:hypothetical protein